MNIYYDVFNTWITSNWIISRLNNNGQESSNPVIYNGCFIQNVDAYVIPCPGNTEVNRGIQSNIQIVKLANGGEVVVSPKIKSIKMQTKWEISEATDPIDLINIEGYIKSDINNKMKVRVYTHIPSQSFDGYFLNTSKIYLFSGVNQLYKLDIDFKEI